MIASLADNSIMSLCYYYLVIFLFDFDCKDRKAICHIMTHDELFSAKCLLHRTRHPVFKFVC